MSETICVVENYGPAKVGQEYKVVKEGSDHVIVSCQGKPIHIPFAMLKQPERRQKYHELPTYEDIVEAEDI